MMAEPGTSGSQVWAGTRYPCPHQNPEESTQQQGPVPTWCLAWASLPCHGKSWEDTGQRVGKQGKTLHPWLPIWCVAPQRHLSSRASHLQVSCQHWDVRTQRCCPHHSPHQQEPICRHGCAGRKHNYHQACLAVPSSRSGGCWALITLAAAFPDGLGSKGCWLSALGLPSARLEPCSWTQLCWGSWARPIQPRWIT